MASASTCRGRTRCCRRSRHWDFRQSPRARDAGACSVCRPRRKVIQVAQPMRVRERQAVDARAADAEPFVLLMPMLVAVHLVRRRTCAGAR